MRFILAAVVLGSCSLVVAQDAYRLRPFAGPSTRGDGGPAVESLLDGPQSMAVDAAGNVYIAEIHTGVIRRVKAEDGVIERVVGTGLLRDGAEGRAAQLTDLISPSAIAIDSNGSVFFGDSGACRVRQILPDNTVRNIAGTGRCSGLGGGFGFGRDRLALDTDLGKVSGISFDRSGRLIFSEEDTHQVRRVDTDGYVRTIVGVGSAGFSGDTFEAVFAQLNSPSGVAFDGSGNLFIADGRNCRVRRVDTAGIITTAAGTGTCVARATSFTGGTPTRTAIGRLAGIAYDAKSNAFYVASPGQARLLRLDLNTARISGILGNGTLGVPDFTKAATAIVANEPWGVAVTAGGKVLAAASTSFQVYQVQDGSASLFAGKWPGIDAPLRPAGTCTAPDGALLIIDAGTERILRRDADTGAITLIAGAQYPTGFTGGDNAPATQAQIAQPKRLFCAANGDVYLTHGSQVRVINAAGIIRTVRSSVDDPDGILIDSEGRLLFSEAGSHRVLRYDFSSRTTTVLAGTGLADFSGDGGAATDAKLDTPGDLAFDSKGNLLIADRGNRRVRLLNFSTGKIESIIGSTREYSYIDITGELANDIGLNLITGLAADGQGNIYVSDGARLLLVPPSGRVTVVAGYAGEDDAGTASYRVGPLNGIDGLSLDSVGRIYASARQDGAVLLVELR